MSRAGRRQTATSSDARRIAVIVSRYNASVTERLCAGAVGVIASRLDLGVVELISAPGAYELPALALAAANTGRYRGIVALGCLIKGETRHDRYIAQAVAHGLIQVTMQTGVPAAFGVITAENPAQARARAGGSKGNKGEEAAGALLDTLEAMDAIRNGESNRMTGSVRPDKSRAGRPKLARRKVYTK